jgi:catechol 2,3-dioxygenase-like lactoylglutathione lyase family enzyme
MATIRHIAIMTADPDKLAAFYCDVFGMSIRSDTPATAEAPRAVFISDGYMEVALIANTKVPLGINHFGFTIDPGEDPDIREKLHKYGIEPFVVNPGRSYAETRGKDPDGNQYDLSTTGLRLEQQPN